MKARAEEEKGLNQVFGWLKIFKKMEDGFIIIMEWVRLSLCFSLKDIKIHTQHRSGRREKGSKPEERDDFSHRTNIQISVFRCWSTRLCARLLYLVDVIWKSWGFEYAWRRLGRVEMVKRTDNFPVMTLIDFKLQIQLGRGLGFGWVSSRLSGTRVVWAGWNEFAEGADMIMKIWEKISQLFNSKWRWRDDETDIIFYSKSCILIMKIKHVFWLVSDVIVQL